MLYIGNLIDYKLKSIVKVFYQKYMFIYFRITYILILFLLWRDYEK